MNTPANKPPAPALRQRAEMQLAAQPAQDLAVLSAAEAAAIVYELRVHQIELEMQNEELRRAQLELDASRARYFDLYDFAPVGYLTLSEQNLILEANLTAATLLGMAKGALAGQPLTRFILPQDQDIFYHQRRRLFESGQPQTCDLRLARAGATEWWARLDAALAIDAAHDGPCYRVTLHDITPVKQVEAERERLLQELQTALTQVKLLSGLLPICAGCKRIRDEQGRWHSVESYITQHSEATFTHGMCDTCAQLYFPEEQP